MYPLLNCTVLAYLVTYLIGHVCLSFVQLPKRFPLLREFTKMATGVYAVVFAYSMGKTHGVTINTLLLIPGFFLFVFLRQQSKLNSWKAALAEMREVHFSTIALQLFFNVCAFAFLMLKLQQPGTTTVFHVYGDFYNYASTIEHLNKTGTEGYLMDWYSHVPPVHTLYHWGELWYAAFYTALFHQKAFFSFYFVLFTHCIVIYGLGAAAWIELFIAPQKKIFYGLAVVILLVCGISFYIPGNTIFTRGDWWNTGLLYQPKYFFIAMYILFAFVFIRLRQYFLFILISISTVIMCTVAASSVFLACGLSIGALWLLKKLTFKEAVWWSVPVGFTAVAIGVFILFVNQLDSNPIIAVHPLPAVPFNVHTAFNCFAGQFIKSALSFFFYALLFWFSVRPADRNLFFSWIVFVLILHIASLLSYAIFYNRVDAVQLWSIVYVPLMSCICFLVILEAFSSKKIVLQIAAILLIILSVIQAHPYKREDKINTGFTESVRKAYDGSNAVFFKSGEDFTTIFSKNVNTYFPSPELKMYYADYMPVCLSTLDIPRSNNDLILYSAEETVIRNSVFYRYLAFQKSKNKFVSIEQSQLDFIKEYDVHFVFAYSFAQIPAAITAHLSPLAKDTTSGITLFRLD